jgi:transposase
MYWTVYAQSQNVPHLQSRNGTLPCLKQDWSVAVGLVIMSERELNRIEVLSQVTQGRMTAVTAANVLGLSRRQVHRLLKDFQTDGPAAIRHKARGRRSNNRIDPAVSEFAVTLVRENYIDFGPTFAAEKLAEDHGLKVSRETLRKWMQDAGIWLSRKQRRTFHQPRLRRECLGELIQMGSAPAQCRMTPQRKNLDRNLLKNMLSKFGTALKRGFEILLKNRAETVQNVFHNLFHNLVSTNGLQILIRN